jgi:REP element-mobilizing transposase RayT
MNTRLPYAYFITFTCYGARLHGSHKGSVDRANNIYNTPYLEASEEKFDNCAKKMKSRAYLMDAPRRNIALDAITNTCVNEKWKLYAAHVRSNHIHIVVRSDELIVPVMSKIKRMISKQINIHFPEDKECKKWTRHGSTRYMWDPVATQAAVHYIIHEQGKPMALYANPEYRYNVVDD